MKKNRLLIFIIFGIILNLSIVMGNIDYDIYNYPLYIIEEFDGSRDWNYWNISNENLINISLIDVGPPYGLAGEITMVSNNQIHFITYNSQKDASNYSHISFDVTADAPNIIKMYLRGCGAFINTTTNTTTGGKYFLVEFPVISNITNRRVSYKVESLTYASENSNCNKTLEDFEMISVTATENSTFILDNILFTNNPTNEFLDLTDQSLNDTIDARIGNTNYVIDNFDGNFDWYSVNESFLNVTPNSTFFYSSPNSMTYLGAFSFSKDLWRAYKNLSEPLDMTLYSEFKFRMKTFTQQVPSGHRAKIWFQGGANYTGDFYSGEQWYAEVIETDIVDFEQYTIAISNLTYINRTAHGDELPSNIVAVWITAWDKTQYPLGLNYKFDDLELVADNSQLFLRFPPSGNPYMYQTNQYLYQNETFLNSTIDARIGTQGNESSLNGTNYYSLKVENIDNFPASAHSNGSDMTNVAFTNNSQNFTNNQHFQKDITVGGVFVINLTDTDGIVSIGTNNNTLAKSINAVLHTYRAGASNNLLVESSNGQSYLQLRSGANDFIFRNNGVSANLSIINEVGNDVVIIDRVGGNITILDTIYSQFMIAAGNMTADWFLGKVNFSYIQNHPVYDLLTNTSVLDLVNESSLNGSGFYSLKVENIDNFPASAHQNGSTGNCSGVGTCAEIAYLDYNNEGDFNLSGNANFTDKVEIANGLIVHDTIHSVTGISSTGGFQAQVIGGGYGTLSYSDVFLPSLNTTMTTDTQLAVKHTLRIYDASGNLNVYLGENGTGDFTGNISADWINAQINYSNVQNHPSMTDTNNTYTAGNLLNEVGHEFSVDGSQLNTSTNVLINTALNNQFDQSLNTTDSVIFDSLNVTKKLEVLQDVNASQNLWVTSILTAGNLRSNDDVALNFDGPDGDSRIFFYEDSSTTGEEIKWDDGEDEFYISDAVTIDGPLNVSDVFNNNYIMTINNEGTTGGRGVWINVDTRRSPLLFNITEEGNPRFHIADGKLVQVNNAFFESATYLGTLQTYFDTAGDGHQLDAYLRVCDGGTCPNFFNNIQDGVAYAENGFITNENITMWNIDGRTHRRSKEEWTHWYHNATDGGAINFVSMWPQLGDNSGYNYINFNNSLDQFGLQVGTGDATAAEPFADAGFLYAQSSLVIYAAGTTMEMYAGATNVLNLTSTALRPRGHKQVDLGQSGNAFDDMYYDDAFNQGLQYFNITNAAEWVQNNPTPYPKPEGAFDERDEELERYGEYSKELSPCSVPLATTDYYTLKAEYEDNTDLTWVMNNIEVAINKTHNRFMTEQEATEYIALFETTHTHPDLMDCNQYAINPNDMVSLLYQVDYELVEFAINITARINTLESQVATLQAAGQQTRSELCDRDPTFSWC